MSTEEITILEKDNIIDLHKKMKPAKKPRVKSEKRVEIKIEEDTYKIPKTVKKYVDQLFKENEQYLKMVERIANFIYKMYPEVLVEHCKIKKPAELALAIETQIIKFLIVGNGLEKEIFTIADKCKEVYPERMADFGKKNYSIQQAVLDILENRQKLITNVDIKDINL